MHRAASHSTTLERGAGPNHDLSELQPPYQRQAARNGACALSDCKFYSFFTLAVHFGEAPIVYLPDTLDRRSWGEFDAYLGVALCLKQAVNPAL
jgi:hypothetical protein